MFFQGSMDHALRPRPRLLNKSSDHATLLDRVVEILTLDLSWSCCNDRRKAAECNDVEELHGCQNRWIIASLTAESKNYMNEDFNDDVLDGVI